MENRFNDETEQEFIDKNALVHLFTAPKEKNGVSTHSIVVFFYACKCHSIWLWPCEKLLFKFILMTFQFVDTRTHFQINDHSFCRINLRSRFDFCHSMRYDWKKSEQKKTQRKSIDKWCNIHPEKIKGVYVSVDGDSKIKHRNCLMCVFITLLCRFFVLSNEKRREFQVFAVAQRVTYSVIALFETDSYIGMQFNRNTYLFCTYIHSYIYIRLVNQYIGTV